MSHIATVDMQIKDLDAMEKACESLGLELVRGKKTYKWYGRWGGDYNGEDAAFNHGVKPEDYGKCDHVIRVKGASESTYEIGLVNKGDHFIPLFDFWQGGYGLMDKINTKGNQDGMGRLKQAYGAEVAAKQMRKQGLQVKTEVKNGKVLVIGR